jgi:uncharacterized Zn finger protein (UPF0148 family)
MIRCPKCDSNLLYSDEDGDFSCYECGERFYAKNTTPYPNNATREQWVQEVAARQLNYYATNRDNLYAAADEAIEVAEAFVAACDKHFNR